MPFKGDRALTVHLLNMEGRRNAILWSLSKFSEPGNVLTSSISNGLGVLDHWVGSDTKGYGVIPSIVTVIKVTTA